MTTTTTEISDTVYAKLLTKSLPRPIRNEAGHNAWLPHFSTSTNAKTFPLKRKPWREC